MARRVFIDTSGWYALIDRNDPDHDRSVTLVRGPLGAGGRLDSTDHVLDESYTLARERSGSGAAFRLMNLIGSTQRLDVEWVGSARFDEAGSIFRRYGDQSFSFTDCTSFVVMRELGLTEALTRDRHFRIAGFGIVPEG